MRKSLLSVAAISLLATSSPVTAADPRIRYITFNNNSVVTVPAGLGVSTMIQLGSSEVIETIRPAILWAGRLSRKKAPASCL